MKLNCEGVSIFQCIVSEVLVTAATTATTCLRYTTKNIVHYTELFQKLVPLVLNFHVWLLHLVFAEQYKQKLVPLVLNIHVLLLHLVFAKQYKQKCLSRSSLKSTSLV